jgi:hypothetical protein
MSMRIEISRRATLKILGLAPATMGPAIGASQVEPLKTGAEPESLTATVTWEYPNRRVKGGLAPYSGVHLKISRHPDLSSPIVDAKIPDHVNSFRLAVAPNSKCYWRLLPFDKDGEASNRMSEGSFVTGKPVIENTESDLIRYRNPRVGAHWEVGR